MMFKGYPSAEAYIYNKVDGFNRIEDMKTARQYHGCSVINDSTVVVAGGDDLYKSSTEYLDLNSLKWVNGPELPENDRSAIILGPEELGPEIGGHLLKNNKIYKLEEEGLTQTRQWTKVRNLSGKDLEKAFVVNQNMFC